MQCVGDKALEIILGRFNDCSYDINDRSPIDLLDEVRNLKIDLIFWALEETNNNASRAAKLLNINRTTMISMMQNELAPIINRREKIKAAEAASINSLEP